MASARATTPGFVRASRGGVLVKLRVSPGARETSVKGLYGEGAAKLTVAAPPVDGEADAEAERFLARLLGVAVSNVTVARGASSRDESVLVRGGSLKEVAGRLGSLL